MQSFCGFDETPCILMEVWIISNQTLVCSAYNLLFSHNAFFIFVVICYFILQAKTFTQMKNSSNNQEISLSQQPFASADKLSQLISDNIRGLKSKLPALHRNMSLYLANPDTEYILLRPVKVSSEPVLQLMISKFVCFLKYFLTFWNNKIAVIIK